MNKLKILLIASMILALPTVLVAKGGGAGGGGHASMGAHVSESVHISEPAISEHTTTTDEDSSSPSYHPVFVPMQSNLQASVPPDSSDKKDFDWTYVAVAAGVGLVVFVIIMIILSTGL